MSEKINLSIIQNKSINTQTFEEKQINGNSYVNYGEDNHYPDFLWDLYLNCAPHQAIVDGTVDYILGSGIDSKFTKQIMRKLVFDFVTFGGFTLQVIYNLSGEVSKVKYLDFTKCRLNSELTKVHYSNEWGKWNTTATEYDVFNPKSIKKTTQILYYRGCKTRSVYPIPRYIAATQAIQTNIEIQNFHLNGIRNGFMANTVINFNSDPSDDERRIIENRLSEKFTGSDNASKFILSFNKSKEDEVTISKLDSDDSDKRFEQLNKDTKENIFIGHRVTSGALFGLVSESTGFNSTEYQESFKIYNKTVIEPLQDELSEILYEIYKEDVIFNPYKIPFNDTASK